jgi:hypothetical protein
MFKEGESKEYNPENDAGKIINIEGGIDPETLANKDVEAGISAVANKESADPQSANVSKLKKIYESGGQFGIDATRVGVVTAVKIFWNILKLAKEAVGGKMSFGRGYELGKSPFEDEKGKK